MYRKLIIYMPALAILIFSSGCASIVRGHKQTVVLTSKPGAALVTADGKAVGRTPVTTKLTRRGPHVLEFSKDGYDPETFHLSSSFEAKWIPANIVFGPALPLGVLVDVASGSMHALDQDQVSAVLTRTVPKSFSRSVEPTWFSIELKKDMTDESAWKKLRDILVRRFDLEVIARDDGYLRTGWLYTWTGEYREDYRVRITVKFHPDEKKVELKTEAQYGKAGTWVQGFDTDLISLIKTDIMGSIGKVTR